jgi:transposase
MIYNWRMKDTQLYQQILGLAKPWRVDGVTLKTADRTIEVEVQCDEQAWACPECGQRAHLHGREQRRWRHLDSCQFKTILVAAVPRVKCPEHGTVTVRVPWAEKHSRFTALFERLAIDVMLECSISAASDLLGISWDEADGIKQRAVRRGLSRKEPRIMKRLCIDEKSFGRRHDYATLVVDPDGERSTVEFIGDGRETATLDGFWRSLSEEQLQGIEAVGMDMWEPYLISTRKYVPDPDAKIVHDTFHLIRHLNEAVDQVRRLEHKQLRAKGDDRLVGSRQLWLYGMENVPDRWQDRFDDLRTQKLKTSKAWVIKEFFRDLYGCRCIDEARQFFKGWYDWAVRCALAPIVRVAKMFKRHLERILTVFIHRLTNAASEGINNKLQSLIQKAYGYRNRERFKADIFFHCGGLSLYPNLSQ